MSVEAREYLHPQGLRPGMRHEGQFKPGNDPKRFPSRRLPDGRTLASLARDYTEESVNVLVSVARGEMTGVRPSDRVRAAEILLDRGWGKPKENVAVELTVNSLPTLTRDQLRAIAAGALLPPIDVEVTEVAAVTASLPPAAPEEHLT